MLKTGGKNKQSQALDKPLPEEMKNGCEQSSSEGFQQGVRVENNTANGTIRCCWVYPNCKSTSEVSSAAWECDHKEGESLPNSTGGGGNGGNNDHETKGDVDVIPATIGPPEASACSPPPPSETISLATKPTLSPSTHSEMKTICNKQFSDYQQLHQHLKTHLNPREKLKGQRHSNGNNVPHSFVCRWENCFKETARLSDLKSHFIVHLQEKPFHCQKCNRLYKRKHDLKAHEKRRHGRVSKKDTSLKQCLEMALQHSNETSFKGKKAKVMAHWEGDKNLSLASYLLPLADINESDTIDTALALSGGDVVDSLFSPQNGVPSHHSMTSTPLATSYHYLLDTLTYCSDKKDSKTKCHCENEAKNVTEIPQQQQNAKQSDSGQSRITFEEGPSELACQNSLPFRLPPVSLLLNQCDLATGGITKPSSTHMDSTLPWVQYPKRSKPRMSRPKCIPSKAETLPPSMYGSEIPYYVSPSRNGAPSQPYPLTQVTACPNHFSSIRGRSLLIPPYHPSSDAMYSKLIRTIPYCPWSFSIQPTPQSSSVESQKQSQNETSQFQI